MTTHERLLMRKMESLLTRQGRVVMAKLDTFDDDTQELDVSAILFDEERWDIIYADELEDVLMPMLVDGWTAGVDKLRAATGKAAKAVKAPIDGWDVFNAEVLSWAQRYPRAFAERINVVFAKRITEVVAQGMAAGENIRELKKRLADKVFDGKVTSKRADMIARTEGSRASHAGEREAWKQSGVVEVQIWRISEGACQFCVPMEGKPVGLDEPYFDIGGVAEGADGGKMNLNYETVQGPPLHPHCACYQEPVLREVPQAEAIEIMR